MFEHLHNKTYTKGFAVNCINNKRAPRGIVYKLNEGYKTIDIHTFFYKNHTFFV